MGGLSNVASGWIQELGKSGAGAGTRDPKYRTEKWLTEEIHRLGGVAASHERCHIKGFYSRRGRWIEPKANPRCELCSEQNMVIAYA